MSTNWPEGVGRRVLPSIDSTNAEAARVASNLSGPEWILALEQTAGRGRRGRAWINPVGNFAATYVMRPTEPPEQVALRSFVAALALYDAFATVTGRTEPFGLKWPNDVLLNGGKVAGILLESIGSSGGVSHLAIGIGVNLIGAPTIEAVEPGSTRPVSLLDDTGARIGPEGFLDILAPSYAAWEAQFSTYGFGPIRTAWLARAVKLGEVITARTAREEVVGSFDTVDEKGNLVLSTPKARRAIPAADIYF